MTIVNAYKKMWLRGFDFTGRSTRPEFWWTCLMNLLINFCLSRFGSDMLLSAYSYLVFIPYLALLVRRMHDSNHRGWNILLLYVPLSLSVYVLTTSIITNSINSGALLGSTFSLLLGACYVFILLCRRSDIEMNRFGDNPNETNTKDHTA